jgi:hypothetical protein
MSAENKSYDRLENETNKAWAAFCIYRNLGLERTHERVCEKIYNTDGNQNPTRNLSQVRTWSAANSWLDRCRDYDRDEEIIERDRVRSRNIQEHDRELEQFRQSNKAMGSALLAMGARLMKIGDRVAREIEGKDNITAADLDTFLKLPASVKAIANFATIGGDLTADGLLIRQLLERMKEEGES